MIFSCSAAFQHAFMNFVYIDVREVFQDAFINRHGITETVVYSTNGNFHTMWQSSLFYQVMRNLCEAVL